MSKNNRNKVYNNRGNAEKNSTFSKVMITIIIIGIIVLLFINFVWPILKDKISHAAAEKTVEMITNNADMIAEDNPELAQMLESMSEEDKETVTNIISEHMDAETVSEVMGYVKDKDKQALVEYATENLSPEEIAELIKIYGKYSE